MEIEIIIAIIGSGLLSTFIVIINDWIKFSYEKKKEAQKSLFRIREEIHREFLKNIDFIYNVDYLSENEQLRKKHNFLKTYRTLYLYGTDEEVRKVNKMIKAIITQPAEDLVEMEAKKLKIAESFLTLRTHVIPDTELTVADFVHIA